MTLAAVLGAGIIALVVAVGWWASRAGRAGERVGVAEKAAKEHSDVAKKAAAAAAKPRPDPVDDRLRAKGRLRD